MRKIVAFVVLISMIITNVLVFDVYADKDESDNRSTDLVESKSAILIEGTTGKVIFEKNCDEKMAMASITKIMTLLLIFDSLKEGKITLDDNVSVSEHAASMGGSQVYLEVNETQTVNDMIKCISIASANDACVAMAEHVAGSEEEFVKEMNEKAKKLGMDNTHFVNCCGLDVKDHYSTARDIAIMGRALIDTYPQVSEYATTWMDKIIHKTKKGEKEFGLTNTNKLVRIYDGITGLKTGSTSEAGYCLCATSTRKGISMVAVVMASKNHKSRFSDCAKLMDYGYGNCVLYKDDNVYDELESIKVKKAVNDTFEGEKKEFSYILMNNEGTSDITSTINIDEDLTAPISQGEKIGEIVYYMRDNEIGRADIVSKEEVPEMTYKDVLCKVFTMFIKSN